MKEFSSKFFRRVAARNTLVDLGAYFLSFGAGFATTVLQSELHDSGPLIPGSVAYHLAYHTGDFGDGMVLVLLTKSILTGFKERLSWKKEMAISAAVGILGIVGAETMPFGYLFTRVQDTLDVPVGLVGVGVGLGLLGLSYAVSTPRIVAKA